MPEESVNIVVQVQPNASQNKVVRFQDGVLHLKIAAPPTKGKANQELLRFISDILGVRKAYLTIEKGIASRKKTIAIKGLIKHQVTTKLAEHQTTAKASQSSLL